MQLYDFIENLVQKKVSLSIYESPHLKGDNGFKLAQVIGIINLIAAKYQTKIITYSATQIKKIVCGTGKATKQDIENCIRKLYDVKEKLLDDVYDAIANPTCWKILSKKDS